MPAERSSNVHVLPSSPFYGVVSRVVVQTCTKYITRIELLRHELRRVGIVGFNTVIQPSPNYEPRLISLVAHDGGQENPVRASIWFGHYRALKLCQDLMYDRVLFLEDDVAFLADVSAIRDRLAAVSTPFSILHLDPVSLDSHRYSVGIEAAYRVGLRGWGILDADGGDWCHSTGCRILTHDAIDAYVSLHERALAGSDKSVTVRAADLWHSDVVRATGLPMLYAAPNLAIQHLFRQHSSENGMCSGIACKLYSGMGLSLSDYSDIEKPNKQQEAST